MAQDAASPNHTVDDPTAGSTTLLEILEDLRAAGFSAQLIAKEGGKLECSACSETLDTADVEPAGYRRTEGASDAADMNIVAWANCSNCGAGAALILGYGPNANAADESVLADLSLGDMSTPGATPVEDARPA